MPVFVSLSLKTAGTFYKTILHAWKKGLYAKNANPF